MESLAGFNARKLLSIQGLIQFEGRAAIFCREMHPIYLEDNETSGNETTKNIKIQKCREMKSVGK